MADLANLAAATAAGYVEVISVRPDGTNYVTLDRTLSGGVGEDIAFQRATGFGANQGAAETAAVAALNRQRADRSNIRDKGGNLHTIDSK